MKRVNIEPFVGVGDRPPRAWKRQDRKDRQGAFTTGDEARTGPMGLSKYIEP